MRRFLPLAFLVGGCWPRIPGSVDDYVAGGDDPGDTGMGDDGGGLNLVGWMSFIVAQGDYWDNFDDGDVMSGLVYFGFVEDAGVDPLDDWGEIGSCGLLPSEGIYDASVDPGGPGTVVMQGSGDVALTWFGPPDSLYYAELPETAYGPRVDWSIAPFDIDAGTVDPGVVFQTPRLTRIVAPPVGGASPGRIPRTDQLEVRWQSTVGRYRTIVQVIPVTASGDSLGSVVCIGDEGMDTALVPLHLLSGLDRAAGAYLFVGQVDVDDVPLGPDLEGRARMGSGLFRQGYVDFQ